MKLTDKQEKFLNHVKSIGRLMTDDEAVDYYVENHMRNDVSCRFNQYRYWWDKDAGKKPKREDYIDDYPWESLKMKAGQWHRNIVGGLVLRGYLKLKKPGGIDGFVKFCG